MHILYADFIIFHNVFRLKTYTNFRNLFRITIFGINT